MTIGKMLKLAVGVVGARFFGASLGLVTQLLLARLFSTEELGRLFFGMSAVVLIGLLVSGGYPALATTELAQLIARKNKRAVAALNGTAMRDTCAVWLLLSAMCFAATSLGLVSQHTATALFFGCIAALPVSLISYSGAIANSCRMFNVAYLPDFIVRPLLFMGFIAAAAWMKLQLSETAVLWAFVAMIGITAAIQIALLGSKGLAAADWFAERNRMTRRLRPRAFAMLIVGIVASTYADLVTLVGGLSLAPADVAVLGVTIRLSAIAAFTVFAARQFMLPDLAEALKSPDKISANALMLRMNLMSLMTMMMGIAAAFVFGRYILGIFGAAYVAGFNLLMMFLVAQLIRALGGVNQQLLALEGKQIHTAAACLTALAVLIASAGVLCRTLGLTGMGWAVLLTETAWCLHLASQARRHLGYRGDLLWLMRQKMTS